jgi:hypothetical protein
VLNFYDGIRVQTVASPTEGGTVSAAPVSVPSGRVIELTATQTAGYTLTSWSISPSGTGATLVENSANPGNILRRTLTVGNADITVTAHFIPDTFNVSFDATNGTGTSNISHSPTASVYTLPATNPTRTNWAFNGWWTLDGRTTGNWGTQVINTTALTNKTAHSVFARWSTVITFHHVDGQIQGDGTFNTRTYDGTAVITLNEALARSMAPSRSGQTFGGWFTNSAMTTAAPATIPLNYTGTTFAFFAKWT